jgi:tetratricopeptide (TPR) repeat protein
MDRAFGDWHRSIRAAAEAGDYERAVALGREALTVFPDDPRLASDISNLMTDLGSALRTEGELDEALSTFQRALELQPNSSRARLGIIDCYRDLGMLEESLPIFDGILDHSPFVRYNYATTLAQLGRYREAAEQFEIVTQIRPDFASAYNNWGNAVELMGDRERAIELVQMALKYEPNHPDARRSLERLSGSGDGEK